MDIGNKVRMYTGDSFHGNIGTIIRIDAANIHWVRTRTKLRVLYDVPCKRAELQYANAQSDIKQSMIDAYAMVVKWSEEDECFVVTVPELPGCMSHGDTMQEARRQGRDAIASWIDASKAWGDAIPVPSMKEAS